jgi:hypothetical protein
LKALILKRSEAFPSSEIEMRQKLQNFEIKGRWERPKQGGGILASDV